MWIDFIFVPSVCHFVAILQMPETKDSLLFFVYVLAKVKFENESKKKKQTKKAFLLS